MQVDSAQFALFVALFWVAWRCLPKAASPITLLVASLIFYAASSLADFGLMVFLAGLNYVAVRKLSVWSNGWKRSLLFTVAVGFCVALLVFYKWACIYLEQAAVPQALRGFLSASAAGHVAFPLGLSFFVFQMVACLTDVYRRQYEWTSGGTVFYLFAFFFPQISAGPIPRAHALVPQLASRPVLASVDLETGVSLFAYGLMKKLIIANRLKIYVDGVFAPDLPSSSISVLLAFVFNALQLYADFSGYTDMARGVARLFGIRLAENFSDPFLAESVTDFWRRWHMTLSSWLKDYLYMPLVVRLRAFGVTAIVLSFVFTFLICGLWHGLSLPFAVFGLLHGAALSLEFLTRNPRKRWIKRWPFLGGCWIGRAYVFVFFVLTNALFRVTDLSQARQFYGKLLRPCLPSGSSELFAGTGPLLFVLNFLVLFLWWLLARAKKGTEGGRLRFVWFCFIVILVFGKLNERGFIYVAF